MKKSVQKLSLHKKAISKLSNTIHGGFQRGTTDFTNISGCCTVQDPTRTCEI